MEPQFSMDVPTLVTHDVEWGEAEQKAVETADLLIEKIKEAKSLAGDLTSMLNVLRIKSDPDYATSLLVSTDEVHIVP